MGAPRAGVEFQAVQLSALISYPYTAELLTKYNTKYPSYTVQNK